MQLGECEAQFDHRGARDGFSRAFAVRVGVVHRPDRVPHAGMPAAQAHESCDERVGPLSGESQRAVCYGQRLFEMRCAHAVVYGSRDRGDAKPLRGGELVVAHDVPAYRAGRGIAVRLRRDHVNRIDSLERDGQAECERGRFVAECPVGVQFLQCSHQVKRSLALRQCSPMRCAGVYSFCRTDDLASVNPPTQALANAVAGRHDARLPAFGT
ncbi:hypothetical protein [Eggerthella sinensis]|uniref:hypothetical protein n=1 Tax=Eggerthella sinensis TaxID=242230 RepID=UPI0022E21156|nr:hypothetical protein [Eggerthella sinensis]